MSILGLHKSQHSCIDDPLPALSVVVLYIRDDHYLMSQELVAKVKAKKSQAS